jgi:AraC-like DNA-binding protein/DNA gyrase inhibitor GyrI
MSPQLLSIIATIEKTIYTQAFDGEAIISVQELADQAGLSRFQLLRLFKRKTGKSLDQFITRIKLETAASFVCLTRQSFIDIAFNLGYSGQQSFTRAFSKHWGISPLKMRTATLKRNQHLYLNKDAFAIPACRMKRERPIRLWLRRYVGSYVQVPQHWSVFAGEVKEILALVKGPYYGVIYDDPDITPVDQIRYGCAIEAPDMHSPTPPGWIEFISPPSRFIVFSLHCSYLEGLEKLRPRVLTWFQHHQETFGTSGVYEIYPKLPEGDEHQKRDMALHISLAY